MGKGIKRVVEADERQKERKSRDVEAGHDHIAGGGEGSPRGVRKNKRTKG